MSDVHERLRRLLFLVPYVRRHPGITVDALAQALDVPVELKQAVLEAADLDERLQRARALVARRRRMLNHRGLPLSTGASGEES